MHFLEIAALTFGLLAPNVLARPQAPDAAWTGWNATAVAKPKVSVNNIYTHVQNDLQIAKDAFGVAEVKIDAILSSWNQTQKFRGIPHSTLNYTIPMNGSLQDLNMTLGHHRRPAPIFVRLAHEFNVLLDGIDQAQWGVAGDLADVNAEEFHDSEAKMLKDDIDCVIAMTQQAIAHLETIKAICPEVVSFLEKTEFDIKIMARLEEMLSTMTDFAFEAAQAQGFEEGSATDGAWKEAERGMTIFNAEGKVSTE